MPPKVSEFKASIYTRSTALIKGRLSTIKGFVEELNALSEPLSQVQLRQLANASTEIRKKRSEFESHLQKALTLPDDDSVNDQVLSQDQDEVNDLYSHIASVIEVLTPQEPPATPSASSEAGTSVHTPISQVRLPKLDLQKFSGNPLSWTSFINLFDATIHRNASLSSVMKFQYLLSVLNDEPLNLIKSLHLTAANYLVAYNLLRDRYHNTRRLQSLHLNQLLDLPNLSGSSSKGLRHFVNLYTENSQALRALDCDVSEHNPLLSALLLRKMDTDLRKKLESFRLSVGDGPSTHSLPEVKDIITFLNTECTQTEDANIHVTSTSHKTAYVPPSPHARSKVIMPKKVQFSPRDVSMVTTQGPPLSQSKADSWPCFACQQTGHKIYSCVSFKNKTPHERLQLVRKYQRCVSCLGNHELKNCHSQATCLTCNKRHHTLLHFPSSQVSHGKINFGQDSSDKGLTNKSQASLSLTSQDQPSSIARRSTVLLGTLLVKLSTADGTTHVFRALLDSGSMCELITDRAAQILGAQRSKSDIQLTGLSQNASRHKGQVYLNIETLSGSLISHQHPMLVLDKLTVDLPRVPISQEVIQRTQRYMLADPTFHLPQRIDIVLGGSLFPQILTHERFSLGENFPHVVGTHFGYVVMGSTPCATPSTIHFNNSAHSNLNVTLLSVNDASLHSSLQQFWHQEEPPICTKKTAEEKLSDDHFQATHSRDINGRYVVQLPFKAEQPSLGSSFLAAERRLHALEAKFTRDSELKCLYSKAMNEHISQGHLVKVDKLDKTSPHYFLPHHGVLKEGSSSTKLRIVYDASCKTSSGQSLNDILMTGRKLQTNICDILLHFRTHRFVFTCDIRQMYLQILIEPSHQNFQLVLWRKKNTEPLSIYKLTRVTFGVNSSPYLAIRTLHQLADDEGDAYPEAARVLRSHTYVDDIISGADTLEEVLSLQEQLISLLAKGGFELRKWASNSKVLLRNFPQDHLETPVFLQADQQPHFNVLGLHWSPDSDCFSYKISIPQEAPTKRTVLSAIAKLYDPCGFLAPFIMLTKCFMQLLWTTGLNWDEPLTPDLASKWQTLISSISHLPKIRIPRPCQLSGPCDIELHGFSDASENGYAAVIYFRCISSSGKVQINQILAKSRVSPLKRVTLPRLELCGAHLLAQLASYCRETYRDHVKISQIYLWSDSSITLTWLQTPPYRLKTFVANRVAQIQELFPSHFWHHVRSSHNPADCASRGILASDLCNHSLWWNGPPWLLQTTADWPTPQFVPMDLASSEEVKDTPLVILTTSSQEEWTLFSRYSSYHKLQGVMAWMLRFIFNCRHAQNDRSFGPLSLQELNNAQLCLIKIVQTSAFSEELSRIKKDQTCSTKLQRISPFIDSNGLLRVGGRLKASSLSYDSQHPYLLPKKHPLVNLLIDKCHIQHLHAGPQLTQALLSKFVWILSARSVIRSRIFKCLKCFRAKPQNKTPLMGELPRSRVTPARPFLSTGIDYCGPFMVKVHTLRAMKQVKVYLCIFVCMVTKAVHVEVVMDLTTDAFIAALTRFVSRRGLCSDIYSDCGTNFVGADAALRKIADLTITSSAAKETISRFSKPRNIRFHFNPPAAPHQGGLWESAVKSAKYHLRRTMGDTVLTLAEFITLTTQVEAMLNSRPLTPLSSDPSDVSALTPGHFLIGTSLAAVPQQDVNQVPISRLKHWQLIQALHQRIWKRWQSEYLHSLQQRVKWCTNSEALKVGDLVLMQAPTSPLSWPLARVEAVHPGADGVVRVVTLKTANGRFTRPAVKVFPLPLN